MPSIKYDPKPPQLVAYEVPDALPDDEPVFENMLLADILDWPYYDEEPWRFDSCKLERCTFVGRTMPTPRFWDSSFIRCDLSALRIFQASLLRTEFLGCRMSGIQLGESTLKDVQFQNCKLNLLSFRRSKLERVVFSNCVLNEADFASAQLTDVVFINCELQATNFDRAKCVRVDMTRSDLSTIKGVTSLKNVRIRPEQMMELAPLLCGEVGLVLDA